MLSFSCECRKKKQYDEFANFDNWFIKSVVRFEIRFDLLKVEKGRWKSVNNKIKIIRTAPKHI